MFEEGGELASANRSIPGQLETRGEEEVREAKPERT